MRKLLVPPAKKAWVKLSTKLRFKLRRKQQHHQLMPENSEKKRKTKSSSGSKRGLPFVNHIKRTAGALSSILFYRRSRRLRTKRYPTLNAPALSSYMKQRRDTNSMTAVDIDDMFDCCNNLLQQCHGVPPPPAADLMDQHGVEDEQFPASPYTAATTAGFGGFPDADHRKEVEEEEAKMEEESDEVLLQGQHRRRGPQPLVGVDLRAELFISSFREEMRLQRQRSFTEYQERLDRSI